MEQNKFTKEKRQNIVLMTVVGVLVVLILLSASTKRGLFSLINFAQESFNPTQKQGQLSEFSNENGYVELKPSASNPTFKKGSQGTIDVNVTLKDKQVAGFTIPVSYDDTKYTFVGAENVDTRFNMYFKNEGNSDIVLVGVQQPTNSEKIKLYKNTVARLIFKAETGGLSDIDVVDKTSKGYKLKINDEKNEVIVPSYGILQVISR